MALSLNPCFYGGRLQLDRRKRDDDGSGVRYAGKTVTIKRGGEKTYERVREVLEYFPELAEYKLPSQQPHDEVFLLKELASNMRDETEEGEMFLNLSQEIMMYTTPKALQPVWFAKGLPRVDDVLNVINRQNRSRHPGYPACLFGTTKGVFIDRYTPDLVQAILARYVCLLIVGEYCETAEDFYRSFCTDFSSFSIKTEAVKRQKYGRGLAAMSITSSGIERLLYETYNESFKEHCFEGYSAIGIGFSKKDSDLLYAASPDPAMQSDVPVFDWTVTLTESLLNVDVAMNSMGIRPDSKAIVRKVAIAHERAVAASPFIVSNGWVYVPKKMGGQRTGRDMTSNFNTMTRARRGFGVDLKLASEGCVVDDIPLCAGDDSNEAPHENKEQAYLALSFPLRDVVVAESLTFCSHDWPKGRAPIGQRIFKSLFNMLLNKVVAYDQFEAFCREYKDHESFSALIDKIFVARPEMKSILNKMISNVILDEFGSPSYEAFAKPKHMGKKKKKASPKRKQSGPRQQYSVMPASKRVSSVPRQKMSKMPHVHAVCSITDPFCVHARGAQRPDGGPPTIPFQARTIVTIIADGTSGCARYTIVPHPIYLYNNATLASTTWTNGATWSDGGGTDFINTYAKEIRIVSMGVVVRSAMTATTAKGLIIMSTDPAPIVSGTYIKGSMAASESEVLTLAAGMEHTWIAKPLGANAHMFQPIAKYTTTMTDFDWTSLVIEVNASDITAGVQYVTAEVVCNVEFTVKTAAVGGGSTSQLQKTPPKPNNAAIAAATHSNANRSSFVSGGIAKAKVAVEKQAKASLDTIMEDGMAFLFGML